MTALTLPAQPWTHGQQTADGTRYFDSSVGATGAWRSSPLPVGGLPAGSIIQWSSNTAPANWLICDGSAVSRSVYSSLFAVIGTTYGTGDGLTTFNLPDLRGRVPVGKNGGTFGTLGATGGEEKHALTQAQLPVTEGTFSHMQGDENAISGIVSHAYGANVYREAAWTGASSYVTAFHKIAFGGNEPFNVVQPYLVVNYIIKTSAGWTAGDSELATRVGALETADAGANKSGLVPVIPTTISVSGGSATANSNATISFSGVTSISLNNLFSSTYKSYRMIIRITSVTASTYIRFRYRASGADLASAYYGPGTFMRYDGVSGTNNVNNETWGFYCFAVNGENNRANISTDIFNPFEVAQTVNTNISMGDLGSGPSVFTNATTQNSNTSFDGISIFTTAGNMTGTIQVYGYR